MAIGECSDMTKTHLIAALAALVTLGACATATPYQAASSGTRGYENQQIESNRWQISFSGNSLTDRQTVETYLLYRAAELTDQQGYDHFRVVLRETEADRSLVSSGYYDPYYSGFACNYAFYGRHGRLRGYPYGFRRSSAFGYRSGYGHGYRSGYGHHDPFWGGSYDYREIIRYEASAEIIMGHGDKPDDPAYFSADEVQANLFGKILRPETT